jgi:hypothetical protein
MMHWWERIWNSVENRIIGLHLAPPLDASPRLNIVFSFIQNGSGFDLGRYRLELDPPNELVLGCLQHRERTRICQN